MTENCVHYAANRRKPLPYVAGALVEDAHHECIRAKKALMTILEKPLPADERYRLIALALNSVHEIMNTLAEIPVVCNNEEKEA